MCCQKVNANLPIYNSTIDFTIDQILFGKPVFRHVNYHDIFLYQSKNDTDWIIGKGLLQNSILYFGKSKSGLAQNCPTSQDIVWWRNGIEKPLTGHDKIFCSNRWTSWSEWSSCLTACQTGIEKSFRIRRCEEVENQSGNNIESCPEERSEEKPCECVNLEKVIREDQKCCSAFDLIYGDSDFNGIFYRYSVEGEKAYYKSKDGYFISWSQELFSWRVTFKDKEAKESLLRIHNDKDCFLEKNQTQRKRRSADFISKTNFDEWKIYEPKKLNWVTSTKKIVIRCR
jgi:hypothetical protein